MGAIRPCQCAAPRQGWGSRLREKDARWGSAGRTMGGCGSAKAAGGGVGVPQKRDGRFANRPYDGEWGKRLGFGWGCPAPAPLWIPAFAGRTLVGERGKDDGGCGSAGGVCGGGGPSTGSGRTDLGGACAVGSGGCDGGRRRPAPRPCPGFPRSRERRWGGVGCGGGCLWWGALRQAQGERNREARMRWGVGDAMGRTETPRSAPLRVPAFAGMTLVGESGKDDGGCGGRRGLLVAVG